MGEVWLILIADSGHSAPRRSSSTPQLLWPGYPAHPMGSVDSRTVAHRRLMIQIALHERRHHHYHRMGVVEQPGPATKSLGCRVYGSSHHRYVVLLEEVMSSTMLADHLYEASSLYVDHLGCCLQGRNRGCRVYIAGMG
jgi:hypothetical protein